MALTALVVCHHAEDPAPPGHTPKHEASAHAPARPNTEALVDPTETLPFPVSNAATLEAHDLTQRRLGGGPLPQDARVYDTPLEDPSGRALAAFYDALDRLRSNDDSDVTKVRVAIYGSSSVAIDYYPAYLRSYLQHRFGDGGIGYVSAVPLWRWHRHDAVRVTASKHWQIEHAQRKVGKLDGDYGLIGASAHSTKKGAWASIAAQASSFSQAERSDVIELELLAQPEGGRLRLELGGTPSSTISTHAETRHVLRHVVDPASIPSRGPFPLRLTATGDGEVRLFGAVFERNASGVVVDALGVGGTRAANILDWQDRCWQEPLSRRAPSLYILAYGANEAVDEDEPIEVYDSHLARVLDRFKSTLPHASCVLVGPVDFRRQHEAHGAWEARERISAIIGVQRHQAFEHGCGFWDSRALMGGDGGMNAWAETEPALAKADHLHPTTLGYVHMGRALADALMARYDAHKRSDRLLLNSAR